MYTAGGVVFWYVIEAVDTLLFVQVLPTAAEAAYLSNHSEQKNIASIAICDVRYRVRWDAPLPDS